MFIGTSNNRTFLMFFCLFACFLPQTLYISSCYSEETEMEDCCGSLRAVSILIGQIVTSHGPGFPLLLHNYKSGTARLERLFMIYGDYKKKGVGVFLPL